MSLSLTAEGQRLVMGASFTPYDSVRDLVEALSALLAGAGEVNVRWNCEPEEFDFKMVAAGDGVQFKVVRYPNHRRLRGSSRTVFSLGGSKLEICLPFWRALRDLRRRIAEDEFDKNWRRPFPDSEMQQLTRLVRSEKRELKSRASGQTK